MASVSRDHQTSSYIWRVTLQTWYLFFLTSIWAYRRSIGHCLWLSRVVLSRTGCRPAFPDVPPLPTIHHRQQQQMLISRIVGPCHARRRRGTVYRGPKSEDIWLLGTSAVECRSDSPTSLVIHVTDAATVCPNITISGCIQREVGKNTGARCHLSGSRSQPAAYHQQQALRRGRKLVHRARRGSRFCSSQDRQADS